MSLKYFVHVSSISNLSDARYCSGMMVDSLGYNLDENSNNILSIDSVKEISQWAVSYTHLTLPTITEV